MTQALTVSNGVSASSRGGGEQVFFTKEKDSKNHKGSRGMYLHTFTQVLHLQ